MLTNEEQTFDAILKSYGGGLYLPNNESELNITYELVHSFQALIDGFSLAEVGNLIKPIPSRIIFNINDSQNINAFAGKFDGQYYISINSGTISALRFIFNHMLSNRGLIAAIGDSHLEGNLPAKLPTIDFLTYDELKRDWGDIALPIPKCNVRRLFADFLTYRALNFIIWHELGHIVSGHVDYIAEQNHRFNIVEASIINNNIEKNFLNHTLEFDADAFAVHVMIVYQRAALKNDDFIILRRFSRFYETEFDLTRYLSMSVFGKFKLFESIKRPLEYILSISHPPALLRQHFIMQGILNGFSERPKSDAWLAAIGIGIATIDNAFNYMAEDKIESIFSVENIYSPHYNAILDNWENVKLLIEPYAYIPLRNYRRE